MKRRMICLSILLIAATAGSALAQNAGVSSGYPTPKNGFSPAEQRGHGLYLRYCVLCHGVFGDGNGDNAPFLDPRPRDFTAATFKCRSTPTGTLPLDSDLIGTLVRGVQATNMPSWRPLTDENRQDLVAYIKTFSERWKTEKPGDAIKIPPETPVSIESIRRGHELFQKMECWKCHGQQGRGDGPSASTLTDSKDQPIRPYNFAMARNDSRFKCGSENQDLYRIFMTGVDGTPMPSFADVMQPNDAWDLVHYLRTLQTERRSKENEVLKAAGGAATLKSSENKSENNSAADSNGKTHSGGH
ncbi:MAG: c-type cytochrome [Acidobacteriales bacterium]|nr:c-type cytochrome [Candidatus Koribacter versatilis]MBI3646796.1 c-type cytochrome [Terriglobales bacterium]